MRITVAQLNYHIGNFEGNLQKMLKAIAQAKAEDSDLIVFSELAVCGYPPRDFLEFEDFIRRCDNVIAKLCEAAHDIAIVVGCPSRNPVPEGKDLYNSAYFLEDGKVKYVQHKTLLPTYDIFDEYRYFEPATEFNIVNYKGIKIALSICEDIWDVATDNPLYTIVPLDKVMKYNPDIILNVSASPFSYTHAEERLRIVRANVDRYKIPMIYVNHTGAQTELIFDGGSIVMSGDGTVIDEMEYFEEQIRTYSLEEIKNGTDHSLQPKEKIGRIHDGLVMGIKDYFGKLGFKKAIVGLSGGIDSAVTTVLAQRALGSENVRVLLMPSQFSSDHSVVDAEDLAKSLGIQYDIIPIEDIYRSFMDKLDPHFEGQDFNVTEENIQARIRGTLLMALSNKFGHILLNTTNKSEMAVGYGTLYGDLAGGLSVLADVYKTEVFQLAEYINREEAVIPRNSITKPPSAELRPNQKDSDSLPDYDILDTILYQYIEERQGPHEIIAMGYDEKLVRRILRLVNINEFKRHQTAPVLRISNKAFGRGRRMPIVAKYLS